MPEQQRLLQLQYSAGRTFYQYRLHQNQKLLGLVSAGGFRDTTRVSMGEPSMWAEILAENAPAVLERLDEALSQLGQVRNWLAAGDKEALREWLKAAAESRAQALGL